MDVFDFILICLPIAAFVCTNVFYFVRTLNRIKEDIKRIEQEQARRAEEARRILSAARVERQKLISYMNLVGITHPFTKEEISKKRRVLSLKYHPDRNNGKDDKMKRVNEACDYLEKMSQG